MSPCRLAVVAGGAPYRERFSMKRTLVALVLLTAAMSKFAAAQWPPDSLTNLKVLPRDITVREIVGVMRGFASGLGVRCIYCHVGDDPDDLGSTDFVSDEWVQKRKAREMIKMVNQINRNLLANPPDWSDPPVEVTCATCHHGVTKPLDIRITGSGTPGRRIWTPRRWLV